MRKIRLVAVGLALLGLGSGGLLTGSDHALAAPAVIGHVYVNDNTSPTNTIAAFARHADGSLTPIAGSPFADGGSGRTGAVSQSSLAFGANGHLLLAADAGSSTISVLRVRGDGTLQPVNGSPFDSHGFSPVSIAVSGSSVYVANDGNGTDGANYTSFTLGNQGQLSWTGWTYTLPVPITIGQILVSPDGTHLAATRVSSSLIDSFTIGAGGQPVAASNSPFTTPNYYGQFGSEFRPTNSSQLFVSNAHTSANGPAPGTVSAFSVGADGNLSPIGASPYADGQTAACWVVMSYDGRYLFVVNTASNSVSSFAVAGTGTLSLIGSETLSGTGPLGALDAGIDGAGQYLYVVERNANAVAELSIADGSLSELSDSPVALPAGSNAYGIAVQ